VHFCEAATAAVVAAAELRPDTSDSEIPAEAAPTRKDEPK